MEQQGGRGQWELVDSFGDKVVVFGRELTADERAFLSQPGFSADLQAVVYEYLEDGQLTLGQIAPWYRSEFDDEQLRFVLSLVADDVAPTVIAFCYRAEFDAEQMDTAGWYLGHGLTFEQGLFFYKSEFSADKMDVACGGFKAGLTIDQVATFYKPEISAAEMRDQRNKLIDKKAATGQTNHFGGKHGQYSVFK